MFWMRTNPIHRMATIRNPMELFDRVVGGMSSPRSGYPAFNLWTDDDEAVLSSELPGIKSGDLEITVSGREVTIQGSRAAETPEKGGYVRRERPEGNFERTFVLPYSINAAGVQAKFANGVLRVTLPRAESDKPRKITVNG